MANEAQMIVALKEVREKIASTQCTHPFICLHILDTYVSSSAKYAVREWINVMMSDERYSSYDDWVRYNLGVNNSFNTQQGRIAWIDWMIAYLKADLAAGKVNCAKSRATIKGTE